MINVDYEWLIKEVKDNKPRNFFDIFNFTCDVLNIDRSVDGVIENWDVSNRIVNILCDLDSDLMLISNEIDI